MRSQKDKGLAFKALHEHPGCFVMPNPWDAGSARILTGFGFEALATTSAGFAFSIGRRDGEGKLSREDVLENARAIINVVDLPVSADLEGGFGDTPEDAAKTISEAARVGLVGGSIEDATGNKDKPLFSIDEAATRIKAAVEAARSLPVPFVLTARAEGFLRGVADLNDVIKRLQAYEAAGADVLFAPGLPDLAAVEKVCGSLKKPFNFMVGIKGKSFSKAELEAAGVKRISLATSLYRAAMTGLVDAAREVKEKGTFSYLDRSISTPDLNAFMKE